MFCFLLLAKVKCWLFLLGSSTAYYWGIRNLSWPIKVLYQGLILKLILVQMAGTNYHARILFSSTLVNDSLVGFGWTRIPEFPNNATSVLLLCFATFWRWTFGKESVNSFGRSYVFLCLTLPLRPLTFPSTSCANYLSLVLIQIVKQKL